MDVNANN
jgi:polo-like kinase 1